MPTPEKHAFLGASSAHRWLNCTAAPHYEEQFPRSSSVYADEGTLAHSICELYARKHFTTMPKSTFTRRLNKLKKNALFKDEMLHTAETYVEHLNEVALSYKDRPYVAFETRVDFSDYVPEGFGTCDCIIIGGDTLHVDDYKHGKGVVVPPENNPQMMLYALGALKQFKPIFGDTIKNVTMSICQPRITSDFKLWSISVDELQDWAESIKPKAQTAFDGPGDFVPGEYCRFCAGRAQCRARAEMNTALEDFKDVPIAGKLSSEELTAKQVLGNPVLSDEEVADLLTRASGLEQWVKDLRDYATQALLAGKAIPGWKLVEGRSNRKFTDYDKVVEAAKAAGYDEALLYERKPLTLTAVEKLLTKKHFDEVLGDFVVKPQGAPTLATLGDKRQPYSSAAADFSEVVGNG